MNYESKIKEFEKILNLWRARKISIFGKICIIKSLALPKLIFRCNLSNTKNCTFCDIQIESIEHLMWEQTALVTFNRLAKLPEYDNTPIHF
jgi:hypothetical protein